MRQLRSIATVAAAAGLITLAGCSTSGAKNDYVDTVNEIQLDAQEAFSATNATQPESKTELAKSLEASEQALADAVTKLEEVDVPEEASAGHPKLVAGIDELRMLFADTASEVKAKTGAAAFGAVGQLSTRGKAIATKIDAAISQINKDIGAE